MMLSGWENNRGSAGVALAMRHGLNGLGKGVEHPAYAHLVQHGNLPLPLQVTFTACLHRYVT